MRGQLPTPAPSLSKLFLRRRLGERCALLRPPDVRRLLLLASLGENSNTVVAYQTRWPSCRFHSQHQVRIGPWRSCRSSGTGRAFPGRSGRRCGGADLRHCQPELGVPLSVAEKEGNHGPSLSFSGLSLGKTYSIARVSYEASSHSWSYLVTDSLLCNGDRFCRIPDGARECLLLRCWHGLQQAPICRSGASAG